MRSRRSGRVCHSSVICRRMACSITSPLGVSVAPLSRNAMSSAMRARWSSMLLRITSVGCAVSTGTIRAWSSSSAASSREVPAAVSSCSAEARSVVLPAACPCPARSSARFASIENSMKPRTKDSVSSGPSAARFWSSTLASASPRCSPHGAGAYRFGAFEQLLATQRTDDIAQQAAEVADIRVLGDGRGFSIHLDGGCKIPAGSGEYLRQRHRKPTHAPAGRVTALSDVKIRYLIIIACVALASGSGLVAWQAREAPRTGLAIATWNLQWLVDGPTARDARVACRQAQASATALRCGARAVTRQRGPGAAGELCAQARRGCHRLPGSAERADRKARIPRLSHLHQHRSRTAASRLCTEAGTGA